MGEYSTILSPSSSLRGVKKLRLEITALIVVSSLCRLRCINRSLGLTSDTMAYKIFFLQCDQGHKQPCYGRVIGPGASIRFYQADPYRINTSGAGGINHQPTRSLPRPTQEKGQKMRTVYAAIIVTFSAVGLVHAAQGPYQQCKIFEFS